MFVGVILIVIGAIFLLQNLGFLTSNAWEIIWPLLLIILGLSLTMRKRSRWHGPWCHFYGCSEEMMEKKEK